MLKLNEITNWEEMVNQITCADCLEAMKLIPDKSVDLVLTDPPYGIGANKNGNISPIKVIFNEKKKIQAKSYEPSNWDNSIPKKEIFDEIFRISKNQIIFGGNYFTEFLPPSRCWIFWHKKNSETEAPLYADGELAWTSFDKNTKYFKYGWVGFSGINQRETFPRVHPTQKPVKLMQWCLEKYSKPNDLILDCFLGSGTTARACKDLGRRFIGIEISEKYCQIAESRLLQSVMDFKTES